MQEQQRGVSPVVAVILLVAVTVALSAVIGGFALNLGQQTTDSSVQRTSVQTTANETHVSVTVITGEADELHLLVNGSEVASKNNVSPGTSLTAEVDANDDLSVVAVADGDSQVISSDNPVVVASGSTAAAPTDGLVARYPFDKNLSDVVAGNDAINYTSLGYDPRSDGYAKRFDGSDDYLVVSDTSALNVGTGSYTFSAYVKLNTLPSVQGNVSDIWHKRKGISDNEWWLFIDNNDRVRQWYPEVSNGTTGSSLEADKWYHIVFVRNGSSHQIFINGSLDAEKSFSPAQVNSTSDANIGRHVSDARYLDGAVGDVRLYNRALNKSEIQDLYDATK